MTDTEAERPLEQFGINGVGGNYGSLNDDAAGRPQWTRDTNLLAEYEYQRADGSHAFYVCKGQRPDGEKVFRTQRLNTLSFSDRLEPEDKVARFPGLGDEAKVLFRFPELMAAKKPGAKVFVMEGEKDVET